MRLVPILWLSATVILRLYQGALRSSDSKLYVVFNTMQMATRKRIVPGEMRFKDEHLLESLSIVSFAVTYCCDLITLAQHCPSALEQ